MSLNKIQYDEILRKYEERQLESKHVLEDRENEIYTKIPRVNQINQTIASLSIKLAKDRLNGKKVDYETYKKKIKDLSKEKEALLKENGFDEAYLSETFMCNDCKDTGFVGSKKCSCFKKEIINVLYEQSNIMDVLDIENFNTFSFDYYADNGKNEATGVSPLRNIEKVVTICKNFITNFSNTGENLFLYGETGVGKTFLSNCIAKEIIERSHSVIYLSAIKLFDILAKATFGNDKNDYNTDYIMKHIYECDLLIIDDLGTELTNSFTSTALFGCINERYLNKKSTIISTNYSIGDLKNYYSERIFSRITSNYTLLKIYGDDIRVKKKLEEFY